jgi:hypothetical protein
LDKPPTLNAGSFENIAKKLLNKSLHALQYFIVWVGNGQRTASFIRLWDFPESASEIDDLENDPLVKNWKQIQMNLLEALFCKAFRTHHGVLDRHKNGQLLQLASYGLNVLTPLAQSGVKFDTTLQMYIHELSATADPQILFWMKEIRPKRKALEKAQKSKPLNASRELFNFDFNNALQKALNDDSLFQAVKTSLSETRPKSDRHRGHGHIPYFGTLTAKIAFVLDYAVVAPGLGSVDQHCPIEESQRVDLPWALQGCRFDETNVLVWTFNFKAFSPLSKKSLSSLPDKDACNYHQQLLNNSNARIVFLCGPRAAEALRFAYTKRFYLELRGFRYSLYIAGSLSPTQVSKRLFLLCPALPARIWSTDRCSGAKISEALRFAFSLLDLKGLQPYSVETSLIAGTILSWARDENLGKDPVTEQTMGLDIQLWLCRKMISKGRLDQIVKIAGSLPRGLLMILYSFRKHLPQWRSPTSNKRQPNQKGQEEPQGRRKRAKGIWDMAKVREIEVIVEEAITETKEDYARKLQILRGVMDSSSSRVSPSRAPNDDAQGTSSGVNLLLGKELPSAESLGKIHLAMSRDRTDMVAKALEHDSALDINLDDLMPLCSEAVDLGILELNKPKRQNRPKRQGRVWKNQVDVFRDREYLYIADTNTNSPRTISVNYCPIDFAIGEDIGDGTVFVKIEIYPLGERHPECYATLATDADPSSRLGFRLRFKPSNGPEIHRYATHGGIKSVWRANAHADILLGKSIEEIACLPRRYIYFWGESRIPKGLERFLNGGYTDGTPIIEG